MKKIKVGIVGCGVIAPAHISSYQLLSDVEVSCVCDIIDERARKTAERFGISKWTNSAAELFANPEIDAVSICTSHYTHAKLALDALAAGKDVLCEKPLASDLAGVRLMTQAAEKWPDRVFAGIFQHRFNPLFRCLRDLVAEGAFGKPVSASMRHHCLRTDEYYKADSWRGTWSMEGGGVLINQAIHFLDLFQWTMGGVEKVYAFYANLNHGNVIETEDTVVGAVRFNSGALGTIEATNASFVNWETSLDITGTDGCVEIRDSKIRKALFRDNVFQCRLEKAYDESTLLEKQLVGKAYYGFGHPLQIADFIDAVRNRRRPYVTASDASETVRLVMACYNR